MTKIIGSVLHILGQIEFLERNVCIMYRVCPTHYEKCAIDAVIR